MNREITVPNTSLLTGQATSTVGQKEISPADQQAARELHMQFTTAFNQQNSAGVAALFTEDGLRVTPQGIIQGRDAIQKDADKRFQSRFCDLSVTPLVVRQLANSIWEAGEWTMKIGDQSVRGYFAMTLVREGAALKIRDDTFNIVPPPLSVPQPAGR